MWKSGIFDLTDINEELIKEIVFFDISYPAMGEPGCVIFFTKDGDEYIISQEGTEWDVSDIVELFPEIYVVYRNSKKGTTDEYGFKNIGNWKVVPAFCGELLVRNDLFERFNDVYQLAGEMDKDIPLGIVRDIFGRNVPNERMVYIKTKESWEQERQWKEMREKEKVENRLSVEEVPWLGYNDCVYTKGFIRFWIRRNDDDTYSAYRWCVQEQKPQYDEGRVNENAPAECYNLFLLKYEDFDVEIINDFENFYCKYIKRRNIGRFVRSYKTIEKAKKAAGIRNEWIGWGNVDRKNVYMIDYERLRTLMAEDTDIFFF